MTTIAFSHKNRKEWKWLITNDKKNTTYAVMLYLDKEGNFKSMNIPEITDVEIARSLDFILRDVEFILVHGVDLFLKERKHGAT